MYALECFTACKHVDKDPVRALVGIRGPLMFTAFDKRPWVGQALGLDQLLIEG